MATRPGNMENLEMSSDFDEPEKVMIFFGIREKFETVRFDLSHQNELKINYSYWLLQISWEK